MEPMLNFRTFIITIFFFDFRCLQLSTRSIHICTATIFFHRDNLHSMFYDRRGLMDVFLDRSQGSKYLCHIFLYKDFFFNCIFREVTNQYHRYINVHYQFNIKETTAKCIDSLVFIHFIMILQHSSCR